ncbi:hypothetical protein AMAG_08525 [Allomyces macrogynus ATCC 38327]|uniref:Brix domain-containing protein n=1 Tax=Allomyces macrogynus (strain ATCC 38327) TaxID=578462 RepID=A0A0L0SLJ8_ALLM3|nr:hypothetical protein AMAG_08525 [Allomyces macrogynus ATCC 38327]|eukprot:KNE63392.1 hypothetical protein AMAG_08525 [Allomyces macrogynus ATCC 38327]
MAKRRRKTRTHVATADDATTPPPRSFVVKSGDVGKLVAHLVRDVRRVMHPNTAAKLRERKSNKLRDYVALAGPLHVSHLAVFSRGKPKPENPALGGALNLRIGKLPRGPTAGFRVNSYSLASDVVALQKTPKTQSGSLFASAPLLVLNNFPTDRNEYKLLATLLQNMFPAISVADMKISSTRRVVLFNYNAETDALDFRHYAIDVKATGVSKGVKKIVSGKGVPDLGKFRDISDYITREAVAAESDLEDGPENTVELPHNYTGRNNRQAEQRAIKLTELGPRMDLSLMKIQEGLCSGEVLFHRFVQKTPAELKALQAAKAKRDADKARRRAEQEANVDRKKQAKEEKRAKKAAKKAAKEEEDDGTDLEYGDGHEDSDDEGRTTAFEQYDDIDDDEDFDDGDDEVEDGVHDAFAPEDDVQSGDDQSDEEDEDDDEDIEEPAPKRTKSLHAAAPPAARTAGASRGRGGAGAGGGRGGAGARGGRGSAGARGARGGAGGRGGRGGGRGGRGRK